MSKNKQEVNNILKFKAFIIDIFMISIPIFYIVFYIIMGNRNVFSENILLGWIYIFTPILFIESIFMFINNGETLGYRVYKLKVIYNDREEIPSFLHIVLRNILLLFFIVLNIFIMFFRKDNKGLHDILTKTKVIFQD